MNSDSLNMVSRLGEGHMPCTFFLSEPQLKTTVCTMGADSLAENTQNAPNIFGQICLSKPKSLGLSKKALSRCP